MFITSRRSLGMKGAVTLLGRSGMYLAQAPSKANDGWWSFKVNARRNPRLLAYVTLEGCAGKFVVVVVMREVGRGPRVPRGQERELPHDLS